MKNIGQVLLGAIFLFVGYRYAFQPERIKRDFPSRFGSVPSLIIRGIGFSLLLFACLWIYFFVSASKQ